MWRALNVISRWVWWLAALVLIALAGRDMHRGAVEVGSLRIVLAALYIALGTYVRETRELRERYESMRDQRDRAFEKLRAPYDKPRIVK